MQETILQDAGLTKGESKVYLSLLRLGESTVGPIAKASSVSLSKIYEVLDNLIKKGLVSSILKNNVHYFLPAEPERIIDYLENKKKEISQSEEKIREIIPSLKTETKIKERKPARMYEGFRGIKTFYENILRITTKEDTICALGIPKYAAEKYEGYFLDWNRRRAKIGIMIKVLYNYDAVEMGKKREKIKYTEVKYLKKDFITPAWIIIFKDIVATIHLSDEPICVVIEDKNVFISYMNFFNMLWNNLSRRL